MNHDVDKARQVPAIEPVTRRIIPDWTDYNDHLNVTWITYLFDQGTDNLLDALQIGAAYAARTGFSTFALGAHVSYLSEARLGEDVEVHSTLVGVDAKRIKYRHKLIAADDSRVIALLEQVSMHVDLGARRSAHWPLDVRARLANRVDPNVSAPLCDGLPLKSEVGHD
ncbi:thioesterase family protein [Paracoccus sp. Z330]|uniref:Thioesterase family protein n=1 Tax=Paracoccus onchidii TaxID=3017813 RepID=A0ABT4ZGC1_9RHOB|nr:thioesterase family protein [Paracoccus onchidii]MDB6178402.1 thioesterase family protein [Paracoccus onchidii]